MLKRVRGEWVGCKVREEGGGKGGGERLGGKGTLKEEGRREGSKRRKRKRKGLEISLIIIIDSVCRCKRWVGEITYLELNCFFNVSRKNIN